MKNAIFPVVAALLVLSSCGKKDETPSGGYENHVILGAFQDITSAPTFKKSKLRDLPEIIDLKNIMTPAKNQTGRGTCSFFSTMGLIEGAIKKDTNMEVNLSEEFLSNRVKTFGFHSGEGSQVSSNIEMIAEKGILLERDLSYQPSWFGAGYACAGKKKANAPDICFTHNAPDAKILKKVISAKGIRFGSLAKNTNNIIRFLAEKKRPLTITLLVNFKGWLKTGETFYNEKLRKECLAAPASCGIHSVVLTGYDMKKGIFHFKNSWGKEWGNNGFGTIPFTTVDKYVKDTLYTATVDSIDLPDDYKEDHLKITEMDISSQANDNGSIDVKLEGKLESVHGRSIRISTFLVKKLKTVEGPPTEANIESIKITDKKLNQAGFDTVSAVTNYAHSSHDIVDWTEEKSRKLTLTSAMMKLSSVKKLLSSDEDELFLKTTVSVYTDNQKYKVLKTSFLPLP